MSRIKLCRDVGKRANRYYSRFLYFKCCPRRSNNRYKLAFYLALVGLLLYLICRNDSVVYIHPYNLGNFSHCPLDPNVAPPRKVNHQTAEQLCCPRPEPIVLALTKQQEAPSYGELVLTYPTVCQGHWRPRLECAPQQNIAIIIPYRNRPLQLRLLLHRLHGMLQHQRIAYAIYLVEQFDETPFNRGLLLNIGIREALKRDPTVNCFIFHDTDLLPANSDNLYLCDEHLRHLSGAIDELRFHLPFTNYAGGVTALSKANVLKINGFPNRYWGWGNEDDELSARRLIYQLKLSRPPAQLSHYYAVRHAKATRGSGHYSLFIGFRGYVNDGLTLLNDDSYEIIHPPVSFADKAMDGSAEQKKKQQQKWLLASKHYMETRFKLSPCNQKVVANLFRLPTNQTNTGGEGEKVDDRFSARIEKLIDEIGPALSAHYIVVNVSRMHQRTIKPVGETHESMWWFLKFYGWI